MISFPKCGRTMVRYALLQYAPDFRAKWTHDQFAFSKKTGKVPVDYDVDSRLKQYAGKKILFIIRDPKDVMVSLWFNERYRQKVTKLELPEFIMSDYAMPMLAESGKMWYKFIDIHGGLIISYESWCSYPRLGLSMVANYFNLPLNCDRIERAISNSSFEKMRHVERKNKFKHKWLRPEKVSDIRSYKCRAGKVGGYVNHLTALEILYINSMITEDSIYARYKNSGLYGNFR